MLEELRKIEMFQGLPGWCVEVAELPGKEEVTLTVKAGDHQATLFLSIKEFHQLCELRYKFPSTGGAA